jgi:hypothetical protein
MLHFLLVPVAAMALTVSDPVVQPYKTGSDLLRDCGSKDASLKAICVGYVLGIADFLEEFRQHGQQPPCIPKGVGADALAKVVTDFLQSREPIHLREGASSLVSNAIGMRWCGI